MDFDSVPYCDEIRLVQRGLGEVGFLYRAAAGCFFLKRLLEACEILYDSEGLFHEVPRSMYQI